MHLPKGDKVLLDKESNERTRTLLILQSLQNFIRQHSELRFHQALKAWLQVDRIEVTPKNSSSRVDTYYFQGKDK